MTHTLLVLSIVSVVVTIVAVILLLVVLRHLRRSRQEIAELHTSTGQAPTDRTTGADDEALPPASPEDEEPAPQRTRQVAVVVNPSKFDDVAAFSHSIRTVVEYIEGTQVTFYPTTEEDPGRGQTRQALQEGADLVVAAGGDGTVRMVASVLAGSDTEMAIIPAGTGNLLARNLEVPLDDPAEAMTAALTGQDRRIDVGWLRHGDSRAAAAAAAEQIFLVISGFGADAEMIGHTDSTMKKRLGWIAYVLGGARTILGRSVDVVLDFPDGTRHAHKARTVLLGNVGKLPGGFVLMPEATADNGRLEIVVAGWRGPAGFSQVLTEVVSPQLVPRGRFKERTRLSSMDRYQATEVRVATAKAQPVQLDGDTDAEATHLIARIAPGALHLRVPSGTEPAET
ncbi:diacylglycerol kinase family protein [Brachybacterium sp. YJGR34]|uniref:diacylglycerol/lipid kinase family protein n=1 Tax=Brachybacterium sp. YJGR34 TaxID=2059911 RepID=UPI000E0A5D6A|nr:diacylglycerol kinase family protein [Brachybacterium sp. YJGR34]